MRDSFSPFVENIVRYVAVCIAAVGSDPAICLYTYVHTIKPGPLPLTKDEISTFVRIFSHISR